MIPQLACASQVSLQYLASVLKREGTLEDKNRLWLSVEKLELSSMLQWIFREGFIAELLVLA